MSEGVSANGGGNDRKASFTFSDVTYKRRKRRFDSTADQKDAEHVNTTCNGVHEMGGQSRIKNHWKTVLHQLRISHDVNDDVLSGCIQKALLVGDSSWSFMSKRTSSLPLYEILNNADAHSGVNGMISDESKRALDMQIVSLKNDPSSSSVLNSQTSDHIDDHVISKVWENVLVEILASEKFALLCDLLVGKLPGFKPESVLDFSVISTKMKNKEYGLSIGPLHHDLQQIWETVQRIGLELGHLATSLSNISRTSLQKQMGSHLGLTLDEREIKNLWGIDTEVKNSMNPFAASSFPCEPNLTANFNQTEVPCPHVVSILNEDGRKPHQNCAACHRLKSSGMLLEVSEDGEEEQKEGLQENSVSNTDPERTKRERLCKLCETPEASDKRFITCDHSLCMYKYYHIRCLKTHQVVRQHHEHGGWYCPSCLCRECLVDKDDELIVMCDGCDEGYHIYCMKPPLSSVPKGKWFCISCNIQRMKLGMRRYEECVLQQHAQTVKRLTSGPNRPMELLLSAAEKVEKLDSIKKIGS